MLTIQLINQETAFVKERLAVKNFKNIELVDEIIALDADRRKFQMERDELQSEMNNISKQIGNVMKNKDFAAAELLKKQTTDLKEKIKEISTMHDNALEQLNAKLVLLPNLPHASVKKVFSRG